MIAKRIRLSVTAVERAQPAPKPYRLWDTKVPELFLRVQPSGVKSWNVQCSRSSSRALGKYPAVTVEAAQVRARALLHETDAKGPDAIADLDRRRHPKSLGQFIDEKYRDYQLTQKKSGAATLAQLERHFAFLYKRPMTAITKEAFESYRIGRLKAGAKAATVNRELDYLKGALSKARELGWIGANPLAGLARIKGEVEPRTRYLSDTEEDRLRDALVTREKAAREGRERYNAWRAQRGIPPLPTIEGYSDTLMPLTLVALNTGLRRGELLALRWPDIDFKLKQLTVHAKTAKSSKVRYVPLNAEALAVLSQWQRQHPTGRVFPTKPSTHTWPHLMARAGIENFRFHDLRHTFASKLVMAGVDLNTVRELLGHADITMTLRYAHLAPEHKAAAVELLTAKPKRGRKAT